MLGLSLLKNASFDVVEAAAVAGTTDLTSDGVDMSGFECVAFVAHFGALTAGQVTQMKLQQSDDDGAVDDYTDLLGSNTGPMADGDSNKLLIVEVVRPQKKFVRAIVDRGTQNAVLNGVIAIRYYPHKGPITQPTASVSASESHVSPAEGTA